MNFLNKMAYPGLTFAIMVGVAIGTAIYFYFNQENNQQQRQNQYAYDGENVNNDYTSDYQLPSRSRASSSGSQRRKRRNSRSKCSICLDDIGNGTIKTISECGHEFHDHCITMWFRQQKVCPNCRHPVNI